MMARGPQLLRIVGSMITVASFALAAYVIDAQVERLEMATMVPACLLLGTAAAVITALIASRLHRSAQIAALAAVGVLVLGSFVAFQWMWNRHVFPKDGQRYLIGTQPLPEVSQRLATIGVIDPNDIGELLDSNYDDPLKVYGYEQLKELHNYFQGAWLVLTIAATSSVVLIGRIVDPSKPRPPVRARIFICYRRADSREVAGRIYDWLIERFGRSHVFRDVSSLEAGTSFPEELKRSLRQSDVLLVVVGDRWVMDSQGRRRLDDENDWVRQEICEALEQRITIVPVLVEQTVMPEADMLPREIEPFAAIEALSVRDRDFDHDFERLVTTICESARRTRKNRKTAAATKAG